MSLQQSYTNSPLRFHLRISKNLSIGVGTLAKCVTKYTYLTGSAAVRLRLGSADTQAASPLILAVMDIYGNTNDFGGSWPWQYSLVALLRLHHFDT